MKYHFTILFFLISIFSRSQTPYTQDQFSYDSLMNVTYGTDIDYAGNIDTLLMDIYKPIGDSNCLRPVMVLVHGGAWIAGSKEDVDLIYMSRSLATKGWVVANINYRLGTHKSSNYTMYAICNTNISAPCGYICDSNEISRAIFRGMQDAKGAIRFMKDRHTLDSSDINNVFIAGESAGGFIALATAFTDRLSEKDPGCFTISNAPNPDYDLLLYGCIPATISFLRPDLGSIDGNLNTGVHDATVKGVGNFFGGVLNSDLFQQQNDTPCVYLFHQGSDVVVNYDYGPILGRTSWECYAQTNLCQSYEFYPSAYGSEGIRKYFLSLGSNAPIHQAEIINNYNYLNDCLANGHSIDNIQLRLQNMTAFFANKVSQSGNDPAVNCQNINITELKQQIDIHIYPDPTCAFINVKINSALLNKNYTITDQLGRDLLTGKFTGEPTLIDVRRLSNGFYVLRTGDKIKKKFRVLKN